MRRLGVFVSALIFPLLASAQPLSPSSLQLQKLVLTSEQQLAELKAIAAHSNHDAQTLERVRDLLERLSAGLEQTLEQYRGTSAYQEALAQAQQMRQQAAPKPKAGDTAALQRRSFLEQSLQANQAETALQNKIEAGLAQAPPGFVTKLHAQAQVGAWRTGTRLSLQLSELSEQIEALRESLEHGRPRDGGLSELLRGSDELNRRQREGLNGSH